MRAAGALLSVFACLPASAQDYSQNGTVDAADFTVWRDLLGTNNPQADGDGDMDVDLMDRDIWFANFNASGPGGGSSGSPTLSVTNLGPNINGNLEWAVRVDPDELLFADNGPLGTPPNTIGGSIAVEVGFDVLGTSLVSVTPNTTNFPYENPGNSPFPFGGPPSSGVTVVGNQIFAALGSDFFSTGTPKDLLIIETLGTATTDIAWSGAYGGNGRLAQAGLNFDNANGMVSSELDVLSSTLLATGTWTNGGIWTTPFFPNNGNGGVNYDVVIDNGSTVTIPAASNIVINGLTLANGAVVSHGSLTVEVAANWTAGTLSGAGTIELAGATNVSGIGPKSMSGSVTNSGTFTWQGGPIAFAQTGIVQAQLQNSGTIELAGDGTSFDFASGSPTFVNEATGTLRRLPSPANATIDVATTNLGTIDVQVGGLEFSRGLTNNGNIELDNGTLISSTVNIDSGGQLSGNGTVVGNLVVGADGGPNQATVSPGFSVGSLQVNGDYDNGANGKLVLDIEGAAMVSFDTIGVTGDFEPGGTLQVDVSLLQAFDEGARYLVVTAGSLTPGAVFQHVDTVGNENIFFAPIYSASGSGGGSGGGSGMQLAGFFEGDMNMNEEYDAEDIQLFALALRDSEAYFTSEPNGYCLCIEPVEPGDIDDNGKFDFDDIQGFASLMAGSGASDAAIQAVVNAILHQVPEPPSVLLFLLGGCLMTANRARRAAGTSRPKSSHTLQCSTIR